jgi:chromosome segregation protein
MHLKQLEIAGFKSFAKKAHLEFSTPITAIVGPNGSGKSNVAEAFRFVLGEQSIKSLRGKRGEDMIFNGSGDLGRLNRASVKVIFDNSKRVLNIDFDEVIIERVVHRDSSNEYLINGSQVRLKDIVELLAGAHIGASGHHIISQGEADRVLTANLKDRREMIEDALGLKIYQYKKLESTRKLEKTDENIKSVESLRKEIAPHLKFLKKQVEKVEKVMEMKESLKALYREYFKREELYLKHERATVDHAKAGPKKELESLDKELTEAKRILSESRKDEKSDHIIALEGKLKIARLERDTVTRDVGRIEGEILSVERIVKKEKERQASLEQKTLYFKDVESLIKRVDVEIDQAESKQDVADVKSILARIRDMVRKFITENKSVDVNDVISDSEAEISRLRNEKISLDKKLVEIDQSLSHLNVEYVKLKDAIDREKDVNRDAEKNVFRIMAKQNELHGILAALKGREEKLIIEEEAFKRELSEAHVIAGREALDFHVLTITDSSGKALTDEEIVAESRALQEDRRKQLEKTKIRIEDSGGGNTDEIMKEYREVEERDAFLMKELADLETSAVSLRQLIAELDERLTIEFKEGITKINTQFQEFFDRMFGGGTASLNVVKEKKRKKKEFDLSLMENESAFAEAMADEEEGEEGVEISVSLPRKKIKGLEMLSGGERALTSIALLFAISQVNPPPFIILDETDAALDEANSRKYGDMIENLSKYSQLILITHNRETMSRAGVLYGVTMGADGGSKLLSIAFEQAVAVAK